MAQPRKTGKNSSDNTAAIQSRRKLKRGLILLAVLLVLIALIVTTVWWLHRRLYSRNPRLTLNVVQISGTGFWAQNDGNKRELVRRLKLNLRKDNILSLDVKKLRQEIKKIPNVADAQIRLVLPDTIVISVNERSPRAFLGTRNGDRVVDADGWVMKRDECFGVSEKMPVIALNGKLDKEARVGVQLQAVAEQLKLIEAVRKTSCFTVHTITTRGDVMTIDMIYHGGRDEKKYLIRMPFGDYKSLLERTKSDIETGIISGDKVGIITLSGNKGMDVLSQ